MVKTVLFVHGTGVRKASYESSAARIAEGLRNVAPAVRLESCLWGDTHGARLALGGASIPEFSLAPVAGASADQVVALWELLARDPFFELRELTASVARGLEPPAEKERKAALLTALGTLADDAGVLDALKGRALVVQWRESVAAVVEADARKEAMAAAARVDTTLRLALSRALVAELQQRLMDDNVAVLPVELRDSLVEQCLDRLGGRDLGGVRDWVASKLIGLGLRWTTAKARRERDALFTMASPTAGDVMLYQARGAEIREFIAKRIGDCGDDVAVLAHSLGGIACVDLLVERHMPQVKLLVTAGSQAPFMYEIGALCSLRFGQPLPAHFPARWLNFYDCNDLLSYTASKVFVGRATDHEVVSGQPFPQSHSAYWDAPTLWQKLAPQLQ
ncbi:hypothetical protein [Delftia sp. WSY_14]|uniref:hypothetical protein n=1 Tax=unclassified Delftia TaxID=2613839 RepID=UPI00370A4308